MKKLETRHYAFLGLFLVVLITMLLNISPGVAVSPETQKLYDYIDSLPPASTLIVSFDHEASALPEINPLSLAILRHLFSKGQRLIGVSLLAEGTAIGYQIISRTAEEYKKVYGQDYVFLGFKSQQIAAILSMGESIAATYPQDYMGTHYAELPLLDSVKDYSDVAGVISIADGSLTVQWIEYGKARFNVPILGVVTAAMVTTYDPYLSSGQLTALLGGLRGAAEYETLLGTKGGGVRGMVAQSISHLYIIAMIIIGNILYFKSRRVGGRS
ncbi:MAG: hypothetical protein SGI97_03810 [candidate division Zixibacteria bacterium]|nr:hypothetical protein [candidate division Zixibacteria bacterium]